MEHQLQQEQHRCSVLQHSLDDRIAELDLERVEKEVSSGTSALIYVAVQTFMMHCTLRAAQESDKTPHTFVPQNADYIKDYICLVTCF